MRLVQIRSVGSFAQLTVGRRGQKCCRKMKTLVASTLFSIRIIRTSFSHLFGRRDDSHGFSPAAARAADSIGLKTMAPRGNVSRATAFQTESSVKSASPFPEQMPTA